MIKDLLQDADERMLKSVESTREKFGSIRTGRASPALLDLVMVDYYGAQTPLKQLANIAATEARLLTVTPYDKASIPSIEKSIVEADLGVTPSNDGNLIRLQIPDLTQDRRNDMAKIARQIAEEGRISVRNARREIMSDLKELGESGDVGKDDEHRAEADLQKRTDAHIGEIEALLKHKEEDLLSS